MNMPFFLLLALAHNQNFGNTDCVGQDGVIHVGDAKLSQSYRVQDSLCTFHVDAPRVDAISVSRLNREVGGYVSVRGGARQNETAASASGEPFAIVPLFGTVSMPRTQVPQGVVQAYIPGQALVSFGTREDYKLIFGKVIVDAYDTREFVYGAPAWLMYATHGVMLLLVLCRPTVWSRVWLGVSLVMDCLVWTLWVWTYTWGGAFFLGVLAARIAFLAYLWDLDQLGGSKALCGVLFAAYVAGVLTWSDTPYALLYGLAIWLSSVVVNWYAALLLAGGIVLNMGAGVMGLVLWLRHRPL